MEDKWKLVKTDFWKPEAESELIGPVNGSETTTFGDAIRLVDEDGKIYLLNFTALNTKLASLDSKKVRIICTGQKTSKNGREYLDFDVYQNMETESKEEKKE